MGEGSAVGSLRLDPMIVLITGGFGFVGGRLGQLLARAGHHVVLGSRILRPAPDWLPEAEVRQTRWSDTVSLEKCCRTVDVVVHAAGMNAQDSAAAPLAALELNAVAAGRLATAARTSGVLRFIYLSTAHVYGERLTGTISEDSCAQNVHPYAASHRAGEDIVRHVFASGHEAGHQSIVVRLSNAVGPPVDASVPCWSLLVNDLCRQVAIDGRLVLRTSGLQERDFIPMRDACGAIAHLASRTTTVPADGIVNVGAGVSRSVLSMAALIQSRASEIFGREPEVIRPLPTLDETGHALAFQVTRLYRSGFRHAGHLEDEVDALLLFCRQHFAAASHPA